MAIFTPIVLAVAFLQLASLHDFNGHTDHYELSEARITQICSYVAKACSSCTALQACFWCSTGNGEGQCMANFNRRSHYNCLGEVFDFNNGCKQAPHPGIVADAGVDFLSEESEKSLLLKLIFMLRLIRQSSTVTQRPTDFPTTSSGLLAAASVSPYASISQRLSELIKAENDKLFQAYRPSAWQAGKPSPSQLEDLQRLITKYASVPRYAESEIDLHQKYSKVIDLIKNMTDGKTRNSEKIQMRINKTDSTEMLFQRLEFEMSRNPDAGNGSLILNATREMWTESIINGSDFFSQKKESACSLYNTSGACHTSSICSWCDKLSACIFTSAMFEASCGTAKLHDIKIKPNTQEVAFGDCSEKRSCVSCVKDTSCFWCSGTKSCHFFPGPAFVLGNCKNYLYHNVCNYEVTLLIVIVPLAFVVFFIGASYCCVKQCYYHQRRPVEVKVEEKPILFKTKNGRTIYQITESEEEEDERFVPESQFERVGKTPAVMW